MAPQFSTFPSTSHSSEPAPQVDLFNGSAPKLPPISKAPPQTMLASPQLQANHFNMSSLSPPSLSKTPPLTMSSLEKVQRLQATGAPRSFSFACGGWLGAYLFGVSKALRQCHLDQDSSFIGSSAGSLASMGLTFGMDFDALHDHLTNEVVPQARGTLAGAFKLREYLHQSMDRFANLHKVETAEYKTQYIDHWPSPLPRLTVVYSSLSKMTARRISSFDDQEHLKQALTASCCATPIAGFPFRLKGEWVTDGGLLDFQPVLDANTITVSPFYCTSADIKPSRYVPMWWGIYPPSKRDLDWLFQLGYEDGLNWIVRSGLVDEETKKTIQIPTKATEYDGEWTTSVGRVIGYRSMESYALDLLYVLSLVCVWKPLACLFVYLELLSRVVVFACKAALYALTAKWMISSVVTLALGALSLISIMLEVTSHLVGGFLLVSVMISLVYSDGIREASERARSDWLQCVNCLRSLVSPSLLLQLVPVVGDSVRHNHDQFLLEHSLMYRLAFHAT